MLQHLYRSRGKRVLGGVFGGIGEMYNIDPTILRLGYAILAVITGIVPAVILYLIAWVIIPEQVVVTTPPKVQ